MGKRSSDLAPLTSSHISLCFGYINIFFEHLLVVFPPGHPRYGCLFRCFLQERHHLFPTDYVSVSQSMSSLLVIKMASTSRLLRNANFNYKLHFKKHTQIMAGYLKSASCLLNSVTLRKMVRFFLSWLPVLALTLS